MISKLICWGKSRDEAISHSIRALGEYFIGGVSTNISFLEFIIRTELFRTGGYNINSVEQKLLNEFESQISSNMNDENERVAAVLAAHIKSMKKPKVTSVDSVSNKWKDLLYE
jgi:acetyl/propionyl-CoA carboxylase alpha subunit